MGRLSAASQAKALEKRRAEMLRLESILEDALKRLGGCFKGRSMDLRKHLSEALKEAQIKNAIKRLADAGRLKIEGEHNAAKSYTLVGND